MAAPVQEYPPWLTPTQVVVTDAAGIVATHTIIVYLPLTYLGPSIPLGDLYTYGGSTYPPTIVTGYASTTTPAVPPPATSAPTASTAIPTPSTETTPTSSAVPTSPSESSSTSSLPTSIISSSDTVPTSSLTSTSSLTPISSLTPTSSLTSPSSLTSTSPPAESSTEAPAAASALTKGQLVGVIVASILGLIFLFVFLLAMWLWCKGRRNRRESQFYSVTPIDEDYYIVGEDTRTPGEGSPRHSGEEADPFLQTSHSGRHMVDNAAEMGSRPGVPRVPIPMGSLSSSGSSSTNNSGYGTLLERPALGTLPSMAEEHEFGPSGHQLTPEEMRQLENESVLPLDQEGEYTGAYAIAKDPLASASRSLDPDNAFGQQVDVPRPPPQIQPRSREARESIASSPSLADAEDAALLTVRRVRVSEAPPPSFPESGPTRSGFLEAIGLPNLSNIGRFSWFNQGDTSNTSPRQSRYSPVLGAIPLSDNDLETGRALLHPDSLGRVRDGIVGVGVDGQRPSSHLSTTSASGGTIWHDAHSSLPGTPQLTMPPRAVTPANIHHQHEQDWMSGRALPLRASPPAYDDPFVDDPRSQSPALPSGIDILDLPAPSALTHFASSSSIPETGTVSSVGLSKNPFPPGLEFVSNGKTWSEGGSASASSSPAWNAMSHRVTLSEVSEHHAPVTVDMLEEQPPHAQETWRSMASSNIGGGFGELGRRTTFGIPQFMHSPFVPSEQGSLHSMRSHINPPSVRSTGSAAASRRDLSGSVSSNSSRPSAHSSSQSVGSATDSINRQIVRSGSITNEGRRRFDTHSPPHSAFISRGFQTPPRATTPADVGLFKHGEVPTIDGSIPVAGNAGTGLVMPSAHFSPDRASTIRTVTSGSTAIQGGRERTTSVMTYGASSSIGEVPEEPLPLANPALSKDWTFSS